jgi:hypothetical protein
MSTNGERPPISGVQKRIGIQRLVAFHQLVADSKELTSGRSVDGGSWPGHDVYLVQTAVSAQSPGDRIPGIWAERSRKFMVLLLSWLVMVKAGVISLGQGAGYGGVPGGAGKCGCKTCCGRYKARALFVAVDVNLGPTSISYYALVFEYSSSVRSLYPPLSCLPSRGTC